MTSVYVVESWKRKWYFLFVKTNIKYFAYTKYADACIKGYAIHFCGEQYRIHILDLS